MPKEKVETNKDKLLSDVLTEIEREYGKGSVGYRYVIVPAMNYLASMPEGLGIGSSYDPFMTFHRRIDFYTTKYIEAGKVYDVLCECGLEEAEGGGFWGD